MIEIKGVFHSHNNVTGFIREYTKYIHLRASGAQEVTHGKLWLSYRVVVDVLHITRRRTTINCALLFQDLFSILSCTYKCIYILSTYTLYKYCSLLCVLPRQTCVFHARQPRLLCSAAGCQVTRFISRTLRLRSSTDLANN